MKNKRKSIMKSRKSLLVVPPTEINSKFSIESDIIANSIIEKIISLTISSALRNKIDNEIPLKCFSYIEEFLTNKLKMEFLPHDSDDAQNNKNPNELSILSNKFMPNNSSFQDDNKNNSYIINKSKDFNVNNSSFNIDQFFYNNYINGENDWDITDEPKSNKYDSYSTTMVKLKEIKKEEVEPAPIKHKKHKKGLKVNELEAVKEEESMSKSNIYTEDKEEENENNKENEVENEKNNKNNEENRKQELKKKYGNQIVKKISLIAQNQNNNQQRKKRNDIDINQFPCQDIEIDDYYNYEEKNTEIDYNKLRKDLIDKEEAKLKEELNKNKKKPKTFDIKQIIGENPINKQYYGKNITVDPNGEIVLIKAIKLNKLKQDFKYPRTVLRNIKQPKKIVKKEKKEISDEKKIEKVEKIIRKEDLINENEKELNNLGEQLNAVNTNDRKILPKISQKKLNLLNLQNLQIKTENAEVKKIKREPVFPSGSNFDLINLEIGVSIKEDEKFKTGGKDFYKKFNKYSKDIYNEKLKESMTANSFLNAKTQLLNDESNRLKTETNFDNTYAGFNMTGNQENFNQKDNSKYLMTSTNNFGNYNYISNIMNSNNNTNIMTKTATTGMNQSNFLNPSIKLSNISSLIGSLDRLNLITEGEEKLGKKNNNIFRAQHKNKLKSIFLNIYTEMDVFTKEILKTGELSNREAYKSQGKNMYMSKKNPEKPSMLELTREIGYKNKPYRNRSKMNSSSINPVLSTVAFFKQ